METQEELDFIREGQRGFSASMSYYSGGGNRSYYIGGFTDGNPMNTIQLSDYYTGGTSGAGKRLSCFVRKL